MSNEQTTPSKNELDGQRFIDYRLDQLELNLRKGIEKLETDFKTQYTQILQTLQAMQEGQNQQNKTLAELTQRVQNLEQRNTCIDKIRDKTTQNTTEIKELERRLDVYKQLLTGVIIAVTVAIIIEIVKFIH